MADRPKHPSENEKTENEVRGPGIGRRKFVKLVGGTGMAVTAGGVLAGAAVLPAIAAEAPSAVMGPTAIPITLRVNGEARKLIRRAAGNAAGRSAQSSGSYGCEESLRSRHLRRLHGAFEWAGRVFVHHPRGRRRGIRRGHSYH